MKLILASSLAVAIAVGGLSPIAWASQSPFGHPAKIPAAPTFPQAPSAPKPPAFPPAPHFPANGSLNSDATGGFKPWKPKATVDVYGPAPKPKGFIDPYGPPLTPKGYVGPDLTAPPKRHRNALGHPAY